MGFTEALAEAVERSYQWQATRGIAISKVTIMGIRYDESTAELLRTVQRADALAGSRGNANLQASTAAGIEAAGEQGGSGGILGIGIAAGSVGLSKMMQDPSEGEAGADEDDLLVTLERLKRALDAGLIQQADYEAAKAKALGLS
jgi:membrane protease subunit (stomatin/prohibitin family)